MAIVIVKCPYCGSIDVVKYGMRNGVQRYYCRNEQCSRRIFRLEYTYNGWKPGIDKLIEDMAINASGIRDTARVLHISRCKVNSTLKKKAGTLQQVNPAYQQGEHGLEIDIVQYDEDESEGDAASSDTELELDEQWSFVGNKGNQRWLWLAIDHVTRAVIAFVFGKRADEVFLKLKALLDPLNPQKYYTDNWGAYERNLDTDKHIVGKQNTQRIERKNLNARTRIKRLARKTICFSKSEVMHDTVIGLYINRHEFGIAG